MSTINKEEIETRKSQLDKDFQNIKQQIEDSERKIITMRNNLNALAGAMQQCDLFLKRIEDDSTPMPEDKKFALDMAAS
jgi:predicted  nucleic acid-binding Zn-ribbon protein|tara:strand:- start:180 stop:416 length:237 start_codon:yes stop_codon:yes gene_type:complete